MNFSHSKVCFKCNIEKSLDEFYTHPQMADGHLNKCKECTRKDTKQRTDELSFNEEWIDKEKERHREKYHRLNYKDKHKPNSEDKKKIDEKYRNKYPEKERARILSRHISTPDGYEKHHWSYNDEYIKDVIFLTIMDHYTIHRFIKYDQGVKMYRDKEGNLLDTKEKSVEYCNRILSKD